MDAALPSILALQEARRAISGVAVRTPLVRLGVLDGPPEIYLKLENLQPTGSFKIRGAMNALAHLGPADLARGVATASAGNMAQGVAWGARLRQVACTVMAPDTAPLAKIRAVERLGGRVQKVPFDEWWRAFETRTLPGVEGVFIHAFDDPHVMAGNGTIGLEILEDLPDADAIVVPWGGGGLACGIAAAVRAVGSKVPVYAAEVETGAPLRPSLTAGKPVVVDSPPLLRGRDRQQDGLPLHVAEGPVGSRWLAGRDPRRHRRCDEAPGRAQPRHRRGRRRVPAGRSLVGARRDRQGRLRGLRRQHRPGALRPGPGRRSGLSPRLRAPGAPEAGSRGRAPSAERG